jgi:hypothetical protein
MPKVHSINRKWLEQRKLLACLHQAERMTRDEEAVSPADDDKNNGASRASDCQQSKTDLVSLKSSGRPAKKRRRSAHGHDRKNARVVVTPQDESTAPHNADEYSVISDTPAQNNRKRKMLSCDAISKAISIGIVPHDNDL